MATAHRRQTTAALPTVFLFDIDGTLVLTGGAGRRAMAGAFESVHKKSNVFEGLSFSGMTDRAIIRHGLRTAKADDHDAAIDHMIDTYLSLLEAELDRPNTSYQIMPGVLKVLERLSKLSADVAIGLGTGNVKRGAYAKLARGKLSDHFPFGGFGCDHEDRIELLRAGAKRGAESLGSTVDKCRVVVIGDTPKDVDAAKGINATCIGVGTGGFTPAVLKACGAKHAFATLETEEAWTALVSPED